MGGARGRGRAAPRCVLRPRGRCLASVAWRCCTLGLLAPRPRRPRQRLGRVGNARPSWSFPCQSPGATPLPTPLPASHAQGLRPPGACNPDLGCASNLVRASGTHSGGPGRPGLLGTSASALSPAAKHARSLPWAFDASLGSCLQHCLFCAFSSCVPGLSELQRSPSSPFSPSLFLLTAPLSLPISLLSALGQMAGAVWGAVRARVSGQTHLAAGCATSSHPCDFGQGT